MPVNRTLPEIQLGVVTVIVVVVLATPLQPDTVYVITVTPAEIPETTPPVLIVPTEGVLLLQVPPLTELVSVMVAPMATEVGPEMVPGLVVLVTVMVRVPYTGPHTPVDVCEMMAVPVAMPETTPVALTVATEALLDDHVPPDAVADSVMVLPMQTLDGPETVSG